MTCMPFLTTFVPFSDSLNSIVPDENSGHESEADESEPAIDHNPVPTAIVDNLATPDHPAESVDSETDDIMLVPLYQNLPPLA